MTEKAAEKQKKQVKQTKQKSSGLVAKVGKNEKNGNTPKPKSADFWQTIVYISAFVAVLLLLVFAYNVNNQSKFVSNLSKAQVTTQHISRNIDDALSSLDIKTVQNTLNLVDKDAKYVSSVFKNIKSHDDSDANVQKAVKSWNTFDQNVKSVLSNKQALFDLDELGTSISEDIPEIQVHYNDAINQMLQTGNIDPQQVLLAKNQVILSERVLRSVSTLAGSRRSAFASADDFKADTDQIGLVLNGQLNGNSELGIARIDNPSVREKLQTIADIYNESLNPAVQKIFEDAPALSQIRSDSISISKQSGVISDSLSNIGTGVFTKPLVWVPIFLVLLFLGILGYALWQLSKARRVTEDKLAIEERERQRKETQAEMQRASRIQEENDRNQTAILRLLDELGDLADGDLTVNATVSEDFTGAIADSVNFAIDQLRQLVSAINRTAIGVAGSSEETQTTAMSLAESSEHQAQEIAGASAAINEMAVSIDQVSANAVESATVADRSVAIAYNGAEVVQRTIDGMNTIREQIQETSKRIKRLGESSQEIGDIISLINDIADQTNILALNAAIQASSAGEAGRGFAVVADEVQRLAERSANATKQIESLVKTIQSDTNEAVASMELTTTEVVKGAKLAKDAGEALEEVQTVSNTLADLIQNISNAARQQAASAGHISNTMNIIQEITTQTTAGTIATARSVGQLNEMAVSLRESVSGFTLPEEDGAISLAANA